MARSTVSLPDDGFVTSMLEVKLGVSREVYIQLMSWRYDHAKGTGVAARLPFPDATIEVFEPCSNSNHIGLSTVVIAVSMV